MNLKMSYNSFIKLKDFFKIVDLTAEVKDYFTKKEILDGTLEINGKYQKRDGITEEYFSESIPFSLVFKNDNFDVNDIVCTDIDYVAIDGRGVDVTFDILVDYYEYENVPVEMNEQTNSDFVVEVAEEIHLNNQLEESVDIDNKRESLKEVLSPEEEKEETSSDKELEQIHLDVEYVSNDDLEEIKQQETNRIDNLLKSTLNFKDDNLPTQEVVIRNIPDKKSRLKVCYYQNDQELESVCEKNNVSLNKVFKENKQRNIEKYHRVIIKEANE